MELPRDVWVPCAISSRIDRGFVHRVGTNRMQELVCACEEDIESRTLRAWVDGNQLEDGLYCTLSASGSWEETASGYLSQEDSGVERSAPVVRNCFLVGMNALEGGRSQTFSRG